MFPKVDMEKIERDRKALKQSSSSYKTSAIPKKVIDFNYKLAVNRMIRNNPKREHPTRRDYVISKIQHNISFFNHPNGDSKCFETLLVGQPSFDDSQFTADTMLDGLSSAAKPHLATLNKNKGYSLEQSMDETKVGDTSRKSPAYKITDG